MKVDNCKYKSLSYSVIARKNDSLLRLTKAKFEGRILLRTCTNGSSELMSNISASIVTMLYNFQLMRLAGEDGIAAYGVVMYVNFVFSAIFIGYSIGAAPVIGKKAYYTEVNADNPQALAEGIVLSTGNTVTSTEKFGNHHL